eukprot:scaffold1243_cov403-Prasinococcus_capsulatus_cf.AAC.15
MKGAKSAGSLEKGERPEEAYLWKLLLRILFAGVATEWLAVSCRESITRMISLKLRPVDAGYSNESFSFLSGPMMKTGHPQTQRG